LLKDKDIRRLQTMCMASRKMAGIWYKRGLKMQYEGRFKSFGFNGEDMVVYSRIQE